MLSISFLGEKYTYIGKAKQKLFDMWILFIII